MKSGYFISKSRGHNYGHLWNQISYLQHLVLTIPTWAYNSPPSGQDDGLHKLLDVLDFLLHSESLVMVLLFPLESFIPWDFNESRPFWGSTDYLNCCNLAGKFPFFLCSWFYQVFVIQLINLWLSLLLFSRVCPSVWCKRLIWLYITYLFILTKNLKIFF